MGGGQESGNRSGTQNVIGAVGFAAACQASLANLETQTERLRELRDECYARFARYDKVKATVAVEKGSLTYAPHIVHVLVSGVESETLIMQLDRRGICVSGGSACAWHDLDPSHVLKALGVSRDEALGALSFLSETIPPFRILRSSLPPLMRSSRSMHSHNRKEK